MFLCKLGCCLGLSMLVLGSSAQQANSIKFGVIVTDHSGADITGLEQKDFTVLEGKTPKPITSFKQMSLSEGPAHLVIVIDALNTEFSTQAFVKQQLAAYFHANSHVVQPTTIATLTYSSFQFQPNFSQNGEELSTMVANSSAGLQHGAKSAVVQQDVYQKSLNAFDSLVERLATIQGRKIVLWISPGWPLLNSRCTRT
jgi:VWFA-related protein